MPVYDFSSGLGLLGQGIDSLGQYINQAVQRNQYGSLGQNLVNNNYDAAMNTAFKMGNPDLGLKLFAMKTANANDQALGLGTTPTGGIVGSSPLPQANAGGAGGSFSTPTGAGSIVNYGPSVVPTPSGPMNMTAAKMGIFGNETANEPKPYDAIGPKTDSGDFAVGRYQVMKSNVPGWTQDVLGQPMTWQQFQASPEAQERVFEGKFGGYAQKYGPLGAANMWFTGSPNPNPGRSDGYMTAGTYGNRFMTQYAQSMRSLGGLAANNPPANPGPVQTSAVPPVPEPAASNVTNRPQQAPTPTANASPQPVQNPVPGSTQSGGGYLSPEQQAALGLPQSPVRQVGPVVQQPPTLASNQGVGYVSPPGYASQLGIGYPGTVAGGATLGPSSYGAGSIGGANMGGAGFSTAFGGPIPGISNSQRAFAGAGQLSPIQTGSAAVPGAVPSPQAGATPAALPPAPRPAVPPPATPAAAPAASQPSPEPPDQPVTIKGKQWTRASAAADTSDASPSVSDVAKAQGIPWIEGATDDDPGHVDPNWKPGATVAPVAAPKDEEETPESTPARAAATGPDLVKNMFASIPKVQAAIAKTQPGSGERIALLTNLKGLASRGNLAQQYVPLFDQALKIEQENLPQRTDSIKNFLFSQTPEGKGFVDFLSKDKTPQGQVNLKYAMDNAKMLGYPDPALVLKGDPDATKFWRDYSSNELGGIKTAPTVNIDQRTQSEEQKKIAEAKGNLVAGYISAGPAAHDQYAILSQMKDALDQGGDKISTGPAGPLVLQMKQFVENLTGEKIEGTTEAEVLQKSNAALASANAKALTNRPAMQEFMQFMRNNPGLQISLDGNRKLIDIQMQIARQKADLSDIALHSKDSAEFIPQRDEYLKANPIINPWTGKAFGSMKMGKYGPMVKTPDDMAGMTHGLSVTLPDGTQGWAQ